MLQVDEAVNIAAGFRDRSAQHSMVVRALSPAQPSRFFCVVRRVDIMAYAEQPSP
jgi:hypothetical protein